MKKLITVLLSSILLINIVNAEELDNTITTTSNNNTNIINEEVLSTSNDKQEETTNLTLNNKDTNVATVDETNITESKNLKRNVKTYIASINGVNYETLDEAIDIANNNDTIILLNNATTSGINLSKNLTIDGKNYTITFNDKGISLWGITLTFKNVNVNMKGITATPYSEWNWMTICASKNSKLVLNNTTMTLDGNGTKTHAIYFTGNNKLELNNSTLEIKNYKEDALEWDGGDGGYNVLLTNSSYISNNNRSGFTGSFYAVIDNSTVKVLNSIGNGSNGTYYTIKNNSNVTFENNGAWGISAWRIDISNNSNLYANNNGYSGIWTRVLNVDSTSSLTANGNGTKAYSSATNAGILFFGNKDITSTIEKGAKVEIKNNAGAGIYTKQNYANLTILSGDITNNGTGSVNINNIGADLGGGIYNIGTIFIGTDVNIYNNHASNAADDIYNGENASIEFLETKDDWVLDDCNDKIDNWYDDSKNNRWNAHGETEEEIHVDEINEDNYKTNKELTIKAAHSLYSKVTAKYIDVDGNVIADEIVTTGKYKDEYITNEKDIQYYKLIDVKGKTEGIYGINDITVIYIYEFVGGIGGDDIEIDIDNNFPKTGVESNNLPEVIFSLSSLLLVGTITLKRRLN